MRLSNAIMLRKEYPLHIMDQEVRTYMGVVKEGSRRARILGYPTLNITCDDSTLEAGVYVGLATLRKAQYRSAVFVDPSRKLLEAHLLGFSGDAYNEGLKVEVYKKIRETEYFENDELLKEAIASDIERVRAYFTKSL